jgi:tetratricopeptide (TPR) repeat protein
VPTADPFTRAAQLHQAGRLRQAEQLYREVLAADPSDAHALSNLGVLLNQADRSDEAVVYLRRAVALRPGDAQLHSNLAVAYHGARDVPSSAAAYREALRLNPAAAPIHVYLGQVLLELGQAEEALACGREALRLRPDFPPAYGLLGDLVGQGRHRFADEDIRRMRALLDGGGLSEDHASLLSFALAAHWDKQADCAEAFRCYRRANDLQREAFRRAGHAFSREQHRGRIDGLIAAFTPDFFARARPFGVASERPVFVVGMVRSGTSLVEQVLASHLRVFGCGELKDIEQLAPAFHAACLAGLDPATAHGLAERYLRRLSRLAGDEAVRVVDKMPHNFLHLGMIAVLFPRARVVHCRRDPLDVGLSSYVQNVQLPYATSLEDLGFYHREYERLMAHWRRALPLRMHEVVYEEMVADPGRVSRDLVAFCGLPWDDRCLAFHQNPRPVQTLSKLQVRQPIYTHAVARWKRYEAHLGPLQEALAGRA